MLLQVVRQSFKTVKQSSVLGIMSNTRNVHVDTQQMWKDVTTGVSESSQNRWWEVLRSRYGESTRHYHTLDHIAHMLSLCREYRESLQDYSAVALATFFHDVIYDPKANDNEERSADLFQQFAEEVNIEDNRASSIYDWIIATKFHTTDAHRSPEKPGCEDLHYMLDFDMAILGVSPLENYKHYAACIRQEYIHVPEEQFRAGRAKVLESFLEVPCIYATKLLRDRFEKQARENIKWEINELRG